MIGRRLSVPEQVQFAGLIPKRTLYHARVVAVGWPLRKGVRVGCWMLLPIGTPTTGFTVAELLCDMAGLPRSVLDAWVLAKLSESC